MKKILFLAFITGSILTSCSKKNNDSAQPTTPLNAAIDAKYITQGTDANSLIVNYAGYKPGQDCDKAVYNAALQTIQSSSNVNTVTINGANLEMVFDRNSNVQPAKTILTSGTELYKAVNQTWPWKGSLTIRKQNSFVTQDQFDKAVNFKVSAVNTGDAAQLTSRIVGSDVILIEFALTKSNPAYSQSVSYELQTSTPITLTSQYKINCLIPGFVTPQSDITIDMTKGAAAPTQKDLGSGVTSYTQELYAGNATSSLSEYIASQYFVTKVYPIVK